MLYWKFRRSPDFDNSRISGGPGCSSSADSIRTADQVLVGPGPDRHLRALGKLHRAAHRYLPRGESRIGWKAAIERHFHQRRAVDHLDPQIPLAIVAAEDVQRDGGQHVAKGVGILLVRSSAGLALPKRFIEARPATPPSMR